MEKVSEVHASTTSHCGARRLGRPVIDIAGQRFGCAGVAAPGGGAGATRTEVIDGQVFTVSVLHEVKPPAKRGARTRMHFGRVNYAKMHRQLDSQDKNNARQKARARRRDRGSGLLGGEERE